MDPIISYRISLQIHNQHIWYCNLKKEFKVNFKLKNYFFKVKNNKNTLIILKTVNMQINLIDKSIYK